MILFPINIQSESVEHPGLLTTSLIKRVRCLSNYVNPFAKYTYYPVVWRLLESVQNYVAIARCYMVPNSNNIIG